MAMPSRALRCIVDRVAMRKRAPELLPMVLSGSRPGFALLVASAALAIGALCCVTKARGTGADGGSTCPTSEPATGTSCSLGVGGMCTYTIAAVRSVHCHCVGPSWDCGPPTGMDSTGDLAGCPARVPEAGATCTIPSTPPYPGGPRPGCYYEVPATPVIHDCACAHYALPARAVWDCGPRGGSDAAVDARGCPARQPPGESLCVTPAETQCQYGYNLSTTCQCSLPGTTIRTWRCTTQPQPPSPAR
jgi:hypothetical protein